MGGRAMSKSLDKNESTSHREQRLRQMDLLVRKDWENTAELLSELSGSNWGYITGL